MPIVENLAGIWKLRNGCFLRMSSWDDNEKHWGGYILDEEGHDLALVKYDKFGNHTEGDSHLDLIERKRGTEGGWPL